MGLGGGSKIEFVCQLKASRATNKTHLGAVKHVQNVMGTFREHVWRSLGAV